MDLLTKIIEINTSSTLKPLITGNATNFDELWEKIIEPNLPKKQAVEGWHKILIDYIKRDNAVFFMRAFGGYLSKTKDKTVLRRGFYNLTNYNFSAFYGDNFFTSFFYSMALDGFVPNKEEFYNAMISRKFPCGFMQTNTEKQYAAFINGKNPEIAKKGYKIAHIFSAGKDYNDSCPYKTIGDFCNNHFPRDKNVDWNNIKNDSFGQFHYRMVNFNSCEEADKVKKFLIAHFLRTVHPINYFLVPKKSNTKDKSSGIRKTNIYWMDGTNEKDEIGENPELIKYVASKIKSLYGKIYDEYLEYIYPIIDNSLPENKTINAKYGIDIWKNKIVNQDTSSIKKVNTKTIKSASIISKKKIEKVLSPFDINSFIDNLNEKHQITMEIFYIDGSCINENWNAQKITKENLWSNIYSRVGHRKDKEKIEKVVFKV